MAKPEWEKRVEKEYEERSGTLYLGNCGLREIPQEIFKMTWIEELIVSECKMDIYGKLIYDPYRHEFAHSNLISKIPDEIRQLSQCKNLILAGNTKYIWPLDNHEVIGEMTQLQYLNLAYTRMKDLTPIARLTHLIKLDVSSNQISKIENLTSLKNLTALDLRKNQISKIENLERQEKLTRLDLKNNRISKIENLSNLENLTMLFLSQNQISTIENLANLQNLTTLNLGYNQISKIENLASLKNLSTLNLEFNQISKIENLSNLENLTMLDLGYNQILKIENLANLENLTRLYLSYNQISKIENLTSLKNLTALDLKNNRISKIENLTSLENLTRLYLSYNQISKIENLTSLENLTALDLKNNRISKIENLANLENLTMLFLSQNQISKIENLTSLKNLITLNLEFNRISKIENLTSLEKLTRLNLMKNQISKIENLANLENLTRLDLGMNKIKDVNNITLPIKLKMFFVYNNPVKAFPHSLLGRSPWDDSFLDHRRSWMESLGEKPFTNDYSKILILGNGNVGKSSILEALKSGKCSENKKSTHGVIIDVVKMDDQNYHVWDFGGQEIFHGTHQMFFTGQAICIVVFDPETERLAFSPDRINAAENTRNMPIQYWINTIRHSSPDSPIIIVQNKKDEYREKDIDILQLAGKHDYPFIQVSSIEGDNIDDLHFYIQKMAKTLYEYKMPMPHTWREVRNHYLQLQKKKHNKELITDLEAFNQTCIDYGVDTKVLPSILTFMHNSGFIYHNASYLGNQIIVDQRWGLDAIYKALDRDSDFYRFMRRYGKGFADISYLFHEWEDLAHKRLLLHFMESCAICTPLNQNSKEYLFPEFLMTEMPPVIKELLLSKASDLTSITYYEPYIPTQLIQSIIIQFFPYTRKELIWKHGIMIIQNHELMCVQFDPITNELNISITHTQQNQYMDMLWERVLKTQKMPGTWSIQEYGKESHEIDINTLFRDGENIIFPPVINNEGPVNIAISYAWEDGIKDTYGFNPLESLTNQLQILERENKIRLFYDQKINENDWDGQIREKFNDADLIIILNSEHYNKDSKKYIWEVEMPIIREKKKENGITCLRINITDCTTPKEIEEINDFKMGSMPPDALERSAWVKKIIEEIFMEKILKRD